MAKTPKSLIFLKPSSPAKAITTVFVTNTQKKIPISSDSVREVVLSALKETHTFPQEISICFVGKKKIQSLHLQFFEDPSATDCITFPLDPPSSTCTCLGEVVVCPQVAADYVHTYGGELYEEITLYVIHGILHLLGHKDSSAQEKKKMRFYEKKMMQALIKNGLCILPDTKQQGKR